MAEHRCPDCGAELSAAPAQAGCPSCLFGLGLDEPREQNGPESVGPYRIVRPIGEGGMGVVYLAEQREPIRRPVAIKIIRPGMGGREVVRRFESERQTLALMDHPSIARVIDAGETLDGLPYFVMEYVDGVPITVYCDRERLSTTERVGLLAEVCNAVQHAHRKGVIHRDIKPSNILVTAADDGSARVKVIDFGVARAIERGSAETTALTRAGMMVGTPAYMSPEQADLDNDRVDTRSDVYGLGVVLYELLTGLLPFDPTELQAHGLEQMRRRIREVDPPTPSSRLSDGGLDTAAVRRSAPAQLQREISGELDWIVMRAMAKEPERRYGSPSELADDLERYLHHEAVEAGPPSGAYRLRKFARRHRVMVASSAAVLAALLLGAAVSLNFAVGQSRALAESERQRAIAGAVNEFMTRDVLGRANPTTGALPDTTLREVIEAAASTIDDRFLDEPLVQASVRLTLARVFYELGEHDTSAEHAGKAAAVNTELLGEAALPSVEARHVQFLALRSATRYDEAEAVLQRNLAVIDRIAASSPLAHATVFSDLGTLRSRQRRIPESEIAYARAIELLEAAEDADPRALAINRGNYGLALYAQKKYALAERSMRAAIAEFEAIGGPDSVDVAFVLQNLSAVVKDARPTPEGRAEALAILDRCYRIRLARLGPAHPETLRTRYGVATVLESLGDFDESERIHREVYEARAERFAPGHVTVMDSKSKVAAALARRGELAEARRMYGEVYDTAVESLGPTHFHTQRHMRSWVRALSAEGDAAGVRRAYERHFAAMQRFVDAAARDYSAYTPLAWGLLNCEVEALRDPARALELARAARRAEGGETTGVYDLLAHAHAANGNDDEAIRAARRGIELLPSTAQPDHREYFEKLIAEWSSAVADDGEQVP